MHDNIRHKMNSKNGPLRKSSVPVPRPIPKPAPPVPQELLTIIVDLGKDQEEHIVVMKDSDPARLAAAFCVKHGLSEEQERMLTQKIALHMNEAIMEERVSSESGSETKRQGDDRDDKEEEMEEVGDECVGDIGRSFIHPTKPISHLHSPAATRRDPIFEPKSAPPPAKAEEKKQPEGECVWSSDHMLKVADSGLENGNISAYCSGDRILQ